WKEVMGSCAQALATTSQSMIDHIYSDITEKKDHASMMLIYTSVFIVLALIFIFILIRVISSSIVHPTQTISDVLISFFKVLNRETTQYVPMEFDGKDELGTLITTTNDEIVATLDGFKKDTDTIEETKRVITLTDAGLFLYAIKTTADNPGVVSIAQTTNNFIAGTTEQVQEINNVIGAIASGNYTAKIPSSVMMLGTYGLINNSLVLLARASGIKSALINNTGKQLLDATQKGTSNAQILSKNSNETAAALEETAAALEEVTSTVTQTTENMAQMQNYADDINTSAQTGKSLANDTVSAMDQINEKVAAILEAITVIDQIAFQTNILSLNAAVEAATAGEAGKGFAVVAQEVRNLASRSAEAANQIKDIVESAETEASSGKQKADEMIQGYDTLMNNINETTLLIQDVSSASKEQQSAIIQINDAVTNLDRQTQENANVANSMETMMNDNLQPLAESLVAIAQRDTYDPGLEQAICDPDFAYMVEDLKRDHVKFKETMHAYVRAAEKKTEDQLHREQVPMLSTETECRFGQWIAQQEAENSAFVGSSEWSEIKEQHTIVHKLSQSFMEVHYPQKRNAVITQMQFSRTPTGIIVEKDLISLHKQIDDATDALFEIMNSLTVVHCKPKYMR
ncbi:MAG: methyl-accepting chemotaxis protein, partial [Patescibacteria group bacterium]|nr:methyl-accepting chemotaxis protein [Patescibacteria group bacterium]